MASTLTKKHFQAIAEILGRNWTTEGFSYRLLADVCDFCAEQNPLFDRDRFLNAVSADAGIQAADVISQIRG